MQFSWDQANIEHIARHEITREEVEQVIQNGPVDVSQYVRHGEERLNQVGETATGRVLVVITTERDGMTRVVTAHPADRAMRKQYQEWKEAVDAADPKDTGLSE